MQFYSLLTVTISLKNMAAQLLEKYLTCTKLSCVPAE